jgi:hypothetical protein
MARQLLRRNFVPGGGSGGPGRHGVVKELGGFDTTQATGVEDWDLWIRLSRVSPLTTVPARTSAICCTPGACRAHRRHAGPLATAC